MTSRKAHKTTSPIADRVPRALPLLLIGVVALLSSCVATRARSQAQEDAEVRAMMVYLQDKPRSLQPFYRAVVSQGRRNRVLNQMHAGLAAFDSGELELARESFDEVLNGIETVYGHSLQAEKARSTWRSEGSKMFKGEPYERAMAYYYRGLLYMLDADYENARACFKSGILQDAFAEEQQHRADFALLILLEGWASQCLGQHQLAQEAYAELKKLRPNFQLPAPDDNVLVLAETGRAPQKFASGSGGAELRYRRGTNFAEQQVRFEVGVAEYKMDAIEDIYWQASTRGGRPIEKILAGQAVFKERHENVGQVLTTIGVGAVVAAPQASRKHRNDIRAIGGAVAVVGLLNLAASEAVKSGADARYWHNLPDAVHAHTFRHDPDSPPSVQVRFFDEQQQPVRHLDTSTSIRFPDDTSHGLAWLRSRRAY